MQRRPVSSRLPVGYRGGVKLPFDPPIEPMLAKAADALPEGDGWLFEPKWDGFRALVFRDGDETLIQSRVTAAIAGTPVTPPGAGPSAVPYSISGSAQSVEL